MIVMHTDAVSRRDTGGMPIAVGPRVIPNNVVRPNKKARSTYTVGMLRPSLIACAAVTAALIPFLLSQSNAKRPPITGVAHVALKTNELAAARRFYAHDLGFS